MIIHKPNEHCYKYEYPFWEDHEDIYYMLPETDSFSYIDTDNKILITEANILFFEFDFPEPLWYYCLQNITNDKNKDINLAMTACSQANIKSLGSIVPMKGYQKNDVIYLGSIMNKAKHLVWIKSEKIVKIL